MTVHGTSYAHAAHLVLDWARAHTSRYICIATVNNVMEAYDSPTFGRVMNEADLVTPDGMPLVWGLKLLGHRGASRVYGPDLTPIVLQTAMENRIPVGFYGSSPAVLERLQAVLTRRFPTLQIAYMFSPPFRPLTREEDEETVAAVNRSGARILFIGLNTPKQDFWMAAHRGRVQAVMLGVGAAFDFLAGDQIPGAPLDDEDWSRMVLSAGDRTAASVEALSEAQSALPHVVLDAVAGPQEVRHRGTGIHVGTGFSLYSRAKLDQGFKNKETL